MEEQPIVACRRRFLSWTNNKLRFFRPSTSSAFACWSSRRGCVANICCWLRRPSYAVGGKSRHQRLFYVIHWLINETVLQYRPSGLIFKREFTLTSNWQIRLIVSRLYCGGSSWRYPRQTHPVANSLYFYLTTSLDWNDNHPTSQKSWTWILFHVPTTMSMIKQQNIETKHNKSKSSAEQKKKNLRR